MNEEQIVVYLDIQKAFDSVSHATLLDKLSKWGFDDSLLRLTHSYLSCRTQRVRINDSLSTAGEVTSGVPQGSIVGPLFFLLYIDDMLTLPEFSHCYCFADDTKICSNSDSAKLQSDLSSISLWAYENQLTFHQDKCCYLHFQKTNSCHLVLGHQTLQEESRAVDLGVIISNDLSWNAHILTKLVKATKSFNFLRHSVPYQVPSSVKFNLFRSCVVSIILYCSSSWSANITLTPKMEKMNHKGLKWSFGNGSYGDLLQRSATMPIIYQKIERVSRLFAGISSGTTCINFHDHFTIQSDNRPLRSNLKHKLVAPTFKRKIVLQSFFPRVTQLVNDLHDSTVIDLITPSHNFKDQLRQYFLLLTRSKYDLNRTCTWHIKCKCSFCISWELLFI